MNVILDRIALRAGWTTVFAGRCRLSGPLALGS